MKLNFILLVAAISFCMGCAEPAPPPTAEELRAEYERELADAHRHCRQDYPSIERLQIDTGWANYEECAKRNAALTMELKRNLKFTDG